MKAARVRPWTNLAMSLGGLLMVLLWCVFTYLHGPTSFNKDAYWFGRDPLFWGSLMSGLPGLLITSGLLVNYTLLAGRVSRLARIAYLLTILGLIIPAVVDLITGTLGSPLLSPLTAIGLMLLSLAHRINRTLPKSMWWTLLSLGVVLMLSFLWALFIPLELSDQIGGYRIFGVLAQLLFGVDWIVFGYLVWCSG